MFFFKDLYLDFSFFFQKNLERKTNTIIEIKWNFFSRRENNVSKKVPENFEAFFHKFH